MNHVEITPVATSPDAAVHAGMEGVLAGTEAVPAGMIAAAALKGREARAVRGSATVETREATATSTTLKDARVLHARKPCPQR